MLSSKVDGLSVTFNLITHNLPSLFVIEDAVVVGDT